MKKTIIYTILLLIASVSYAQEINWVSLEEALAMQEKAPKKIIMDVYTNWCGPCKYKENTFTNPEYNPAKASRRNSAHQFARYMRINAYPTLVFFDEKGDFITPIKG